MRDFSEAHENTNKGWWWKVRVYNYMYYIKIELLLVNERVIIDYVHTIDGNTQLHPSI